MVKLLVIMEKYHSGPNYGLTNSIHNVVGAFNCTDYGSCEIAYIDPEEIWSSQGVDHVLMTKEYDAAFISVYHMLPSQFVAQQVGHKTVMAWWDGSLSISGMRYWSQWIHQICFDYGKGEEEPNIFCLEVPQDTSIFYPDDNVIKDIDVSFVGSIDAARPDRAVIINRLKEAGFNVWAGGGRGPGLENLSIQEYANIFRRSKICLNLSYGHGRGQRKGRTFEIGASRAFMLCNCCEMLQGKEGKWFENEVDYASFDDINIIDRVRYFLNHEEERNQMANRMHEKYMNNYSPKPFWKKVLGICGVNI